MQNIKNISHEGFIPTWRFLIFATGQLFDEQSEYFGTVCGIVFWLRIPFYPHRLKGGKRVQKLYLI